MENKKPKAKKLSSKFNPAAISFAAFSVTWLVVLFILTLFELFYNGLVHEFPKNFGGILFWSLVNDILFWFKGLIFFFLGYIVLYYINPKLARITYSTLLVLQAILQLGLISYFTTALVPLGADLYSYSLADIKQTVGAAGGVNFIQIAGFIL